MTSIRALALLSLVASPALAQDGQAVTLDLDWSSAEPVRVIQSWKVERNLPTKQAWSGVVRSQWSPVGADGIASLSPVSVYALPRGDADAVALDAAIATPWTVRRVVEAIVEPEPEPTPPVVEKAPPEGGEAEAPEGTETSEEAAAAAAAAAPPAAVPAPVAVPEEAPPAPVVDLPTEHPLLTLVRLDEADLWAGSLDAFGEGSWTVGEAVEETVGGVVITREITATGICPDGGPGTKCATLSTVALHDGAQAEGVLSPGQRRLSATWTVDVATGWIHGGQVERAVTTGTAEAPIHTVGTVHLQVQPAQEPAPLPQSLPTP